MTINCKSVYSHFFKGEFCVGGFFGIFIGSILVWSIFIFFFLGLLLETMWGLVLIPAFIFAVMIMFVKEQDSRINKLEEKLEELMGDKKEKTSQD